ncbi:unnamed protein product [Lactuca virosa]|uniref:F-box associated beta-propeller type 3 domain-containing protein n=1 Tax=Lactuca virosa TaxID=75947 RepID=A0AAU9MWW5_9ASTR|nr:unnamed protein product [Lactuca virosa]
MANHVRFGYDPKTDDYKVVKLTRILQPPGMIWQVEVYSMKKGSWEFIIQTFPLHLTQISDLDDETCADGHLHWLCYCDDLEQKQETIVAFDLGVDTFNEILFQVLYFITNHHGSRFNYLGVLAGKLCVMSCVDHGECEVWVMDEYGVAESWVKQTSCVFPV